MNITREDIEREFMNRGYYPVKPPEETKIDQIIREMKRKEARIPTAPTPTPEEVTKPPEVPEVPEEAPPPPPPPPKIPKWLPVVLVGLVGLTLIGRKE